MKNVKFLSKMAQRLCALRWCVLLAALAIAAPQMAASIKIAVKGNAPYLYAYGSSGDTNGSWPGAKMTNTTTDSNGDTWYYAYVDDATTTIIFNNGNSGTDNQTENITLSGSGTYYFYSNGSNYYLNFTSLKDYDYFYFFENNKSWSGTIYCHHWGDNNASSWPGTAMTKVGGTNGGNTVYVWASSSAPTGIIFDNNSVQTVDITPTNKGYYYCSSNSSKYSVTVLTDYTNLAFPTIPDDVEVVESMYLIGNANTQQWAANAGIAMEETAEGSGIYTLTGVTLTAGSEFSFSTVLGSNKDDWTTLATGRLMPSGGDKTVVLDEAMPYVSYNSSSDYNWIVSANGAYNITVNTNNNTVTITSTYGSLYMGYGVDWSWDNAVSMYTVDGNTYHYTVDLTSGDYFLFSKNSDGSTPWGATTVSYEITDQMLGYAQKLVEGSTNNYHFTGTSGKYIVTVNLEKGTVTLRRTASGTGKTETWIFLQKTDNVTLNPTGGTQNNKTVSGVRGGIYSWNKLNLEESYSGGTYSRSEDGPTNYTYSGEVGTDFNGSAAGTDGNYVGDGYLYDKKDTTTIDGKQWYAWAVKNSICEFYFIRNNKTDYKSQKIMRRSGEVWLTWVDEDATSNRQDDCYQLDSLEDVTRTYYDVSASGVSDCAQMLEGHYYVYYTNTTGWDEVYCYAWDEDQRIDVTGKYPGNKCTFVGYDEDGYEVWCYDFGLLSELKTVPTNVIFNNGKGSASEGESGDNVRQQTGDLPFSNGGCYDYLGLIYLGNSLGGIINNGIVNGPKYTVEDDLVGVYYDKNAVTKIVAENADGSKETFYSVGALYAKDLNKYNPKSKMAEGTTDYVYGVCAHYKSQDFPGGSQIQLTREDYDQSNWVKIVISPNFDNENAKSNTDVTVYNTDYPKVKATEVNGTEGTGNVIVVADADGTTTETTAATDNLKYGTDNKQHFLEQYVGHIIPAKSMSGNLVNNVNPEMHITNIGNVGKANDYEKNVYITSHFNDTIIYSYVHNEWNPGTYEGTKRTKPIMGEDENGKKVIARVEVEDSLYKMFYVAPKPQEVVYITWAVYDNESGVAGIGTPSCESEPSDPGAFYGPMNWNRIGDLWGGTDARDVVADSAAWGTTYGPFSNGYMQYGAFKVNWSLFEGMGDNNWIEESNSDQAPWYQIFKPGQAYKIMAIVRYAFDDAYNGDNTDYEYVPGVYGTETTGEEDSSNGDHVLNAPRRTDYEDNYVWPDMQHVPYNGLASSKLIVFPIRGAATGSNGSDIGNVTAVEEVNATPTSKDIVSVRYYNLMGMESKSPFEGVNIVVTTYSDGTRTSSKVMR